MPVVKGCNLPDHLLYDVDKTGWLGVARIAMGWPLAAVGALVTYLAIRTAQRALHAEDVAHRTDCWPTAAADHEIEKQLTSNAGTVGESRSRGRRVLFVPPLGIMYRIEPDGYTVSVLRAWVFRPKK